MKKILFVIIFVISYTSFCMTASAKNTGLSTEPLPDDNQERIVKNMGISIFSEEPEKQSIRCFDVNNEEMIAIGSNDFDKKLISVYSKDGIFQYGYSFNCDGDFGVEWNNGNINIYLVRSDLAITVSSLGEIESILKIEDTAENNSYWHNSVFSDKRIVNNTSYVIKNELGIFNSFSSPYTQLAVTNSDGETSIIYDVNSYQLLRSALILTFASIFICLVLFSVIKAFIKSKHKA